VFLLIERSDYYRDADTDYEALAVQRNAPRWIKKLKQYGYISLLKPQADFFMT